MFSIINSNKVLSQVSSLINDGFVLAVYMDHYVTYKEIIVSNGFYMSKHMIYFHFTCNSKLEYILLNNCNNFYTPEEFICKIKDLTNKIKNKIIENHSNNYYYYLPMQIYNQYDESML